MMTPAAPTIIPASGAPFHRRALPTRYIAMPRAPSRKANANAPSVLRRSAERLLASTRPMFLHHDSLGNHTLSTNAAGQNTGRASLRPFGSPHTTIGDTSIFGFTGAERDDSIDALSFKWRSLDPHSGRWRSPDPGPLGIHLSGRRDVCPLLDF